MAVDVASGELDETQSMRMPHVSTETVRRLRRGLALLQRLSPSLAARVALRLFLTPVRRVLNRSDAQELSRARRHELQAGRRRFIVHEWGSGDRTAVILHGWGSHAARFATLARPLRAQGWRVLAIDAPGHGDSGGGTSSLPDFGAALESTIAEFGSPQLLIGHSLGALAITMRLGEADGVNAPVEAARLRGAILIAMPVGAAFFLERFIAMMELHEPAVRLLRERFTARFGQPPESFSALSVAPHVRLPVLIIHDVEDDIVPLSQARALQAAIPGAQLFVTHELGHSGMLRDRETITAIINFAAATGT
jgi:pimeloyl-ACP methyl ester carboxylesterase